MNSKFEKTFTKNYFNKQNCDRLQFELSSPTKREKFFSRIAHTSKEYIKKSVIVKINRMPLQKSEISEFLFDKNKSCYIIAYKSEYDGKFVYYDDVIDSLWSCGVPYIIISENGNKAYMETEYNFSEHWSYLMKL